MKAFWRQFYVAWRFYTLRPNEYRECMENVFVFENLKGLNQANAVVVAICICFSIFPIVVEKELLKAVVYLGSAVIALILYISARQKLIKYKQNGEVSNLYISTAITLYYINIMFTGLYIGVLAPVGPAVAIAFICYLIVALFMFVTSPLFSLRQTLGAVLVFIICSVTIKASEYLVYEIASVLLASVLAVIFGWQINRYRIMAAAFTRKSEIIIQNLPGVVFQHLYDQPENNFTFMSEGCMDLTGYTAEELIGKNVFNILRVVQQEDADNTARTRNEMLRDDLASETIFQITTKDGGKKRMWERSRVIEKRPDGTPYLVEGYCTDITARWRLEAAEREKKRMESRIDAIIGTLPGMVYQCINNFPEYTILYVSEGSKEFTGYTPEELIGGPNKFMAMVHPDDVDGLGKKSEETIDLGLPFEHSYRLIMPDGSIKWIWDRMTALDRDKDGNPISVAGYMFDITKEKRLEAEKLTWLETEAEIATASNEAKSRFLAMMSHEIRTPMNSIMGFAELALESLGMEKNKTPKVTDYLGKIKDSIKWLMNIINDVLDISKIESGKFELEHTPFDLQDVLMQCQSVIFPQVADKGLELNVYAEPIQGKKLMGDPLRLYQVLLNLLSNAVKFSHSGAIKLSAKPAECAEEGRAKIYFEVRDPGIGMTAEQISKIFDPFVQAESDTTRKYGGTGLGLSITKTIVEMMDGKLSVESSPGMGSKFSFELVFETIDISDDEPDCSAPEAIEKPRFEGLVLICDDNLMNKQVMCEHLANVGLRTVVAGNGKEGVDKVRERVEKGDKPFDLIFMDYFMPVMDGLEAASAIKALNTGTPIIALTANIIGSELEKYKKHGMHDCLGKPFTSQQLWCVLLKYLVPVSLSVIAADHDAEKDESVMKLLKRSFVRSNTETYESLKKAVDEGDIALAERMSHTLKSNAGQLGEQRLLETAATIEEMIRNSQFASHNSQLTPHSELHIPNSLMSDLRSELELVLKKLTPMLEENIPSSELHIPNSDEVRELFEKLELMLVKNNPECIHLLDKIRSIPQADQLASQIEEFEFREALTILKKLKQDHE